MDSNLKTVTYTLIPDKQDHMLRRESITTTREVEVPRCTAVHTRVTVWHALPPKGQFRGREASTETTYSRCCRPVGHLDDLLSRPEVHAATLGDGRSVVVTWTDDKPVEIIEFKS